MAGLRVERGVKETFKTKCVRSRLKWAVHVEIVEDGNLAKRAEVNQGE